MISYSDISKSIEARKEFCASLVDVLHHTYEAHSQLNAVIELFSEALREGAREADARSRDGTARPLEGLLVGIKDNILIEGNRCSAASRILDGYRASCDATVLRRLRAAGALIAGRLNMDEFGMGSSGETSIYGKTDNPVNPRLTTGGSSSGPAAAVAAGLMHAALGSDTGGSVRHPAACTGTVGIKPTYGRVSRNGLIAFASSFDQIGVIAPTVEIAASLLRHIAGQDPADATTVAVDVPDYTKEMHRGIRGLNIGMPEEYVSADTDADVRLAVEDAKEMLRSAGAVIRHVSLPDTELLSRVYMILANVEAASNLARYDGMRYGRRSTLGARYHESVAHSRGEGFGIEVKKRILLGTRVLSAEHRASIYEPALRERGRIRIAFDRAFKEIDLLLLPVLPSPPEWRDATPRDPLSMYRGDAFLVGANLAGLPAISVPMGIDSSGRPRAVQLMASAFREDLLFAAAAEIQHANTGGARYA